MLTKLNQFIITLSTSWWKFLLVFAGTIATLFGLQKITGSFPDISGGHVPFDMQNGLTSGQIFEQLATYTEQAFSAYNQFQIIDYFFPLFAGLMMAAVAAFSLRILSQRYYDIAKQKNLFLLILLPTLCDWTENIMLLAVISMWPDQSATLATLAVTAKKAKLITLFISQPVVLLMLLGAVLKSLVAALKRIGARLGIIKSG
jgi:hypothetical protein